MKKLTEIFKVKKPTISFEFFPPKTEKGFENLANSIDALSQLNPDFISCTYGAGGGNREKTFDISQMIQDKYNIPALAHLTCVLNTKDQIKNIIDDIKARGITNILALRGDPPADNPNWEPGPDNFPLAKDLCQFIRDYTDDHFCIGVAGFPEGHFHCEDKDLDSKYLKIKMDHGADFITTQFFFDNRDYFQYVNRLKNLNINAEILPGVMPITNYNNILRFCANDNISITDKMKETFEPIKDDPEATMEACISFAVDQCNRLLAGGAPGLHFYCLNKVEPVRTILSKITL